LHDRWNASVPLQHVRKSRDADTEPPERKSAVTPESIAGVDPIELIRRFRRDTTGSVGGPIQRRIVMNDHDSVRGQMDVEFEPICTGGHAEIEGGNGVFWSKRAPASVGKYLRMGVVEKVAHGFHGFRPKA